MAARDPASVAGTSAHHSVLTAMAAKIGRDRERDRWIIDPDRLILKPWYALTVSATFYNMFMVPLRVGFQFEPSSSALSLDYLCDAIYVLDIALGFFVGYYDAGNKVMERALVQRHHKRTSLLISVLSVLPFDLVQIGLGRWEPTVRANRLLRFAVGIRQLRALLNVTTLTPPWLKIVMLLLRLLLIAHFCACGWYLFGSVFQGFGPRGGWLPPVDLHLGGRLGDQYLFSLHWSLGTLTGLADNHMPETASQGTYSIAVEILGTFFFAHIVGVLGSLDEEASEAERHFQAHIQHVREALQQHHLPATLQQGVINFYSYQHARCKGADEAKLLHELPHTLHVDIMLHLFENTVSTVPFFAGAEEGFMAHLVKLLKPRVCGPGEVLVEEGSLGEDMFFILKGNINVVVKGLVVSTLSDGNFFGEYAALMNTRRSATVVATSYCDFYVLSQSDLQGCLFFFPLMRAKLEKVVSDRTAEVAEMIAAEAKADKRQAARTRKPRGDGLSFRTGSNPGRSSPSGASAGASPPRALPPPVPELTTKSIAKSPLESLTLFFRKLTRRHAPVAPHGDRASGEERRSSWSEKMGMAGSRWSVSCGAFAEAKAVAVPAPGAAPGVPSKPQREVWLIEPSSRLRVVWLCALLLVQFYNGFGVPFRCAFSRVGLWEVPSLAVLDVVADLIYWSDILLTFRLAFLVDFAIVRSRREIALRYLKGRLTVDLLSSLPFEAAASSIGAGSSPLTQLLRVPRLLRLLQVNSQVDELRQIAHSTNFTLFKLGKLIALFVLSCEWVACLYFLLFAKLLHGEGYDTASPPGSGDENFLPPLSLAVADAPSQFVYSLYVAVSLLTGHGQDIPPRTNPQLLFALGSYLIGVALIAYVIGSVGVLISSLDAAGAIFARKFNTSNDFVQRKRVPLEMQQRVHRFYDAMWARGPAVNIRRFADELHPPLRKEVMTSICHKIISSMPMFASVKDRQFTEKLSEVVQLHAYPAGEWVVRRGTIGCYMYFVTRGTLDCIFDSDGPAGLAQDPNMSLSLNELAVGDFFGEGILLGEYRIKSSVRAREYTECVVLLASDFERIIANYPEVEEALKLERAHREHEAEIATELIQKISAAQSAEAPAAPQPGNRRSLMGGHRNSASGPSDAPVRSRCPFRRSSRNHSISDSAVPPCVDGSATETSPSSGGSKWQLARNSFQKIRTKGLSSGCATDGSDSTTCGQPKKRRGSLGGGSASFSTGTRNRRLSGTHSTMAEMLVSGEAFDLLADRDVPPLTAGAVPSSTADESPSSSPEGEKSRPAPIAPPAAPDQLADACSWEDTEDVLSLEDVPEPQPSPLRRVSEGIEEAASRRASTKATTRVV